MKLLEIGYIMQNRIWCARMTKTIEEIPSKLPAFLPFELTETTVLNRLVYVRLELMTLEYNNYL